MPSSSSLSSSSSDHEEEAESSLSLSSFASSGGRSSSSVRRVKGKRKNKPNKRSLGKRKRLDQNSAGNDKIKTNPSSFSATTTSSSLQGKAADAHPPLRGFSTLDSYVSVACSSKAAAFSTMDRPHSTGQGSSSGVPAPGPANPSSAAVTGVARLKPVQKVNGPPRSSPIWNYFAVVENDRDLKKQPKRIQDACKVKGQERPLAVCTKCFKIYRMSSGTGVLSRHLETKHQITEKNRVSPPQLVKEQGSRQITIDDSLSRVTPYSLSQNKKHMDNFIRFVVLDLEPMSVCESAPLRRFISALNPRYRHPGRKQVRDAISRLAIEKRERIREVLSSVDSVHFTIDFWTSIANKPFLGVTMHWVDPELFTMDWIEVRTKQLPYPHTADHIVEAVRAIVEEEDLKGKVSFITTDNASNMVNAMETAPEFNHIRCAAHSLQLVIQAGLKHPEMAKALEKVKIINGILSRPKQEQLLREAQEKCGANRAATVAVVKDVDTRWNSTFGMLERYTRLRTAISCYINDRETELAKKRELYKVYKETSRGFAKRPDADLMKLVGDLQKARPSEQDWRVNEALIELLEPFKEATTWLGGSDYPTLSVLIPLRDRIKQHLVDAITDVETLPPIRAIAEAMKKVFDEKWKVPGTNAFIASFLDPRFRDRVPQIDPYLVNRAKEQLHSDLAELEQELLTKQSLEEGTSTTQQHGKDGHLSSDEESGRRLKKKRGGKSMFDSILLSVQAAEEEREELAAANRGEALEHEELQRYRKAPLLIKNLFQNGESFMAFDVLKWWQTHRADFPLLSKLAMRYLGVPATSVPSERHFSAAGSLISKKRSRLGDDIVDDTLFCRSSMLREGRKAQKVRR